VIDALLFVFGRRAKQIRLKKLCELIHSSKEFPNLRECRVSVHFADIVDTDDADGFEIVPNTEFVISRSANRSSTSKYYINNGVSSFTEVTTLLKTKGIDLDNNRFLILQGEVEQIAMMKPKAPSPHEDGFLEYLEDIIGTNKYVEAIEESFQEVERLNDARGTKLDRVRAVDREKEALEGAKAEAESFMLKQLKIDVARSELLQLYRHNCVSSNAEAEENRAALQARLDEEQAKLSEFTSQVKTFEKQYADVKAEYDTINKEMLAAKSDFQAYERKDIKYREDIKHQKSKLKKLKGTISRNSKKIVDLQTKMEQDEKSAPKLQSTIEKLSAHKLEAEQQLDQVFESLRGQTEHLRVDMEAKQKQLIPLKNKVNEAQQRIAVVESQLAMFNERDQEARAKIEEQQNALAKSREHASNIETALTEHDANIKQQKKRLPAAQRELEQVTKDEEKTATLRASLRARTAEAKASMEASKSQSTVVTQLMKAQKRGTLPGILGRLGSLGAIDNKYDVAVSTACRKLNSIVVDTASTGQKCVDFLRKHNIGRASFILLEKMEYLRARSSKQIETPENVPRLFDLIKVKDKSLLPAFYYAMNDTLVAENLEQAVRIANANGKRWRVVTMAGQLIDTTGTMSGGGTKVMRGAMSARVSSNNDSVADIKELDNLSDQLDTAESDLQRLRARKVELEAEIAKMSKQISAADVARRKMVMDLENTRNSFEQQETQLQESMSKLEELQDAAMDEMEPLEAELKEHRAAHAQASKNTEKLEASISRLEKAIMDAGGAKLRTLKAKVEQLTQQAHDAEKTLTKIGVEKTSSQKKITNAEKAIAKAETEREAAQQELEELEAEYSQMDEDALAVQEAYNQADEALKAKETDLKTLQKQYDQAKKATDKIRVVEIEISNELDKYSRELHDARKKIQSYNKQLSGLKKKIRASRKALVPIDEPEEVQETQSPEEEIQSQNQDDADMSDAKHNSDEDTTSTRRSRRQQANSENVDEEDEDEDEVADDDEELDEAADAKIDSKVPNFRELTEEQLLRLSENDLKYNLAILEEEIGGMAPNMKAIQEYQRKEREYAKRVVELDSITSERDGARKVYETLRKKRLDEFMDGFSTITMKLKEMYQMLTLGGDAELELVDSLDPFSEGIVFSVRPPKKSWKNIQNLSGGEKTLSSLALVFALHHYKPTPLYVMDEIDAALDFKNVSIVANYIKERTKNAQFVIISLRNNMFELADRLVGIYKTHDVTKSITIDPRSFSVPTQSNQ
jgi:structural maintenance of chromosome 4